jgi:8-oxo-dGTP pyrophosphatase MutT (NUDIX family)
MWAAVGGHPEPYMMLHTALGNPATAPINEQPTALDVLDGHRRWLAQHAAEDSSNNSGTLVIRELFEAVLREVEEELGLGADAIVASRLLGTFSAAWVEGKVDVVFVVDTHLTFAQVATVYAKGHHQDAFEHTALDGLSEAEVHAWLDQADDAKAAAAANVQPDVATAADKDDEGQRDASPSAAKARRNISPYTRATLDVYLRATSSA